MKAIASRLNSPHLSTRNSSSSDLATAKSEGDIRAKALAHAHAEDPEPSYPLKHTVSNSEKATSAKLAALSSPCFFHRRFGDAVDINKVLEEIAEDASMSHSRLLQTATGVREVSKQLQRRPIKRAVRTVMIVTKARDNSLVSMTRDLAEWLLRTPRYGSAHGVTVYVDHKLRSSKRFDAAGLVAENPDLYSRMLQYWTPDLCWSSPERFDLVLTLGGDGTVLFTSWLFQQIVPPILSFSLGSLGFLTPFNFLDYQSQLNHVMGGVSRAKIPPTPSLSSAPSNDVVHDTTMRVNLRMRFTCTVFRAQRHSATSNISSSSISSLLSDPLISDSSRPRAMATVARTSMSAPPSPSSEETQFEVLNELVIDRGPSPYVSNLELFSDDHLLTVIQADGVIFSTPTGSTAYSLSAGGSLVHPDIPAILLTPICPHTLSFRPMLLNDTMPLKVAVPKNSRATAYCSFDGKSRIELRKGDYVEVKASKYPFPTVVADTGGREWIDSVSRTLRWNTRQAQQKAWGATQLSRDTRRSHGGLRESFGELAIEEGADLNDEQAVEEEEEYDIEFDDEEPVDSRDSGYEGDAGSNASAVGNGIAGTDTGTSSPAKRNVRQMTL